MQVDRATRQLVVMHDYAREQRLVGIRPVPLPVAEIAQYLHGPPHVLIGDHKVEVAMGSGAFLGQRVHAPATAYPAAHAG